MDFSRIEQLLAKYWECETSLEEEKELREFFTAGEVPEHLKKYTTMFVYFSEERKNGSLDQVFDREVLDKIKNLDGKPKGRSIKLFYDFAKIAATILVVIVATYFIREEYFNKKDNMDPYLTDTFEDPKEAFEETKKALMIISANFNKGRKEARKLGTFSEAQEKVKNTEEL